MSLEAPTHTRSIDNTTPTEGLGAIDDIYNAVQDMKSGDVTTLVSAAQSLVSEAGNMVLDPIGGLGAMVVE